MKRHSVLACAVLAFSIGACGSSENTSKQGSVRTADLQKHFASAHPDAQSTVSQAVAAIDEGRLADASIALMGLLEGSVGLTNVQKKTVREVLDQMSDKNTSKALEDLRRVLNPGEEEIKKFAKKGKRT